MRWPSCQTQQDITVSQQVSLARSLTTGFQGGAQVWGRVRDGVCLWKRCTMAPFNLSHGLEKMRGKMLPN